MSDYAIALCAFGRLHCVPRFLHAPNAEARLMPSITTWWSCPCTCKFSKRLPLMQLPSRKCFGAWSPSLFSQQTARTRSPEESRSQPERRSGCSWAILNIHLTHVDLYIVRKRITEYLSIHQALMRNGNLCWLQISGHIDIRDELSLALRATFAEGPFDSVDDFGHLLAISPPHILAKSCISIMSTVFITKTRSRRVTK